MSIPYDYIQIVTDQDWGLVGIIPNNGSKRSKNPFSSIERNLSSRNDKVSIPLSQKIPLQNLSSNKSDPVENPVSKNLEATIVNRRRPNVIAKKIENKGESLITHAEPNISLDMERNRIPSVQNKSKDDDISNFTLFGEISNLAGIGNRDNVLVGFGR